MATAQDYFTYKPVHGAPEAAAGVFAVAAVLCAFQIERTRGAFWLYILVVAAVLECAGFITRAICISHASLGLYIASRILLLVPPNALAIMNYKAVSQILVVGQRETGGRGWRRPGFLLRFFILGTVASSALQIAGSDILAANAPKPSDLGRRLYLAGTAVMVAVLALFISATVAVAVAGDVREAVGRAASKRVAGCLLATTALLQVRAVDRVIEYALTYNGTRHIGEWSFYVFDFSPMVLAFIVYNVLFIGRSFPRGSKKQVDRMVELRS
ncbi:hypothetical protein LPJ53_001816 [Coemansia erecta]|uniref:RTA1 like protein n=1 Tax=Coemansia erecta TaxID=147472 RepID=A0A9W7Y4L0_9FUNG|nr:hypothetical protein LPJ53_001816 [Coemansia erecta]